MTDEEKRILNERAFTCPHCKGRLPDWMRGAFRGKYLNKKLNTFCSKMFCTKECYEDYKKDFVVEVYNEQPIYCVEIDGEKDICHILKQIIILPTLMIAGKEWI